MPKKRVRRIFISATGQNDGKTVVSLGLVGAFKERFNRVGFIKPVGQRYLIEQGEKVDEDSVLIDRIYGMDSPIKDMSPIAIEKGFTASYIKKPNIKKLAQQIKKSFKSVSRDKDLVIIEGTGHAGVGSVFDLSNAAVAELLDSEVVIISSGGIGKPIDQVCLNAALYKKRSVKIAGVIINKVKVEKYEKINRLVRLGLKRKGLRVLGVIPYQEMLSRPTIGQLADEIGFKVLSSQGAMESNIGKILVGAMSPHEAIRYFSHKCLVITPGDREDLLMAVVGCQIDKAQAGFKIAGVVLTGGIRPHKTAINMLKKVNIPVLQSQSDTYSVASRIHDLMVKVQPEDFEKTRIIKQMIEKYVNIDLLSRFL